MVRRFNLGSPRSLLEEGGNELGESTANAALVLLLARNSIPAGRKIGEEV